MIVLSLRLTEVSSQLTEVRNRLVDVDLSPFESNMVISTSSGREVVALGLFSRPRTVVGTRIEAVIEL